MESIKQLLKRFWIDGFRFWGLIAPFCSLLVSVPKLVGRPVNLAGVSWSWAILPILVWLAIAYVRRQMDTTRLESLIEPKLVLSFNEEQCVRDVHFDSVPVEYEPAHTPIDRYVSVTIEVRNNTSISNVVVYLHSIHYVSPDGTFHRVDIEGSPYLEWTRTGGKRSHESQTLHAGRQALVNVLHCSDICFPADIYISAPEQLLREQGAMGYDGVFRVVVRASGEGAGAFAELALRVQWDGVYPDSLEVREWPPENA